ncbi:hypothetical protein N0V82_004179 [Gnomoniopsis sp. IMI 355080]|nr:hypothetical protein N0V82_004179 [Gnomoniopsis sp. IMI 355080]
MTKKEETRIRQAEPCDVDAVTDVLIAAMPADRDWWDYRFQYREQYPDEHRRLFRLLIETWIAPAFEDWVVMVAELFDAATGTWQVGAYAAWDVAYVNRRKHGAAYEPLSGTLVFSLQYFREHLMLGLMERQSLPYYSPRAPRPGVTLIRRGWLNTRARRTRHMRSSSTLSTGRTRLEAPLLALQN